MSRISSSGRRVPNEPRGQSREHQARGLLQALGLVRRCMRLPSTTAQERANWADEEVRLLAELNALHARGVDLSRFPGGAEFATAGAEAIGAG